MFCEVTQRVVTREWWEDCLVLLMASVCELCGQHHPYSSDEKIRPLLKTKCCFSIYKWILCNLTKVALHLKVRETQRNKYAENVRVSILPNVIYYQC